MFPVNSVCCCWKLGYWDELEEGRLGGKIFVFHGQKERGDHRRISATEQRLRLGGIESVGTEGKLWSAVSLLVQTFLFKDVFLLYIV